MEHDKIAQSANLRFVQSTSAEHNQSALLLQLMQSLNDGGGSAQQSPIDMLATLRPMLSPKEQKLIDLMIKFREIRVLMDELFE